MLSSQAEATIITHSEAQQRALERCCASPHKAPRGLDQMTSRGLFQSKLFYCLVTLQLHEHWNLHQHSTDWAHGSATALNQENW